MLKIFKIKFGRGFALLSLVILVVVIAAGVAFFLSSEGDLTKPQASFGSEFPTPSPSPFEFWELTIPYLRNREYKSNFVGIREVEKNVEYTSYFATYESDTLKINGLLTKPNTDAPDGGFAAIV